MRKRKRGYTHAQNVAYRQNWYAIIDFNNRMAKKRKEEAEKQELDEMCDTVFRAVFGEDYKEKTNGKDSEGRKDGHSAFDGM